MGCSAFPVHFFVESIHGQRFKVSDPPCNSFQGVTAVKNKENLGKMLNCCEIYVLICLYESWIEWYNSKEKNVHKPH